MPAEGREDGAGAAGDWDAAEHAENLAAGGLADGDQQSAERTCWKRGNADEDGRSERRATCDKLLVTGGSWLLGRSKQVGTRRAAGGEEKRSGCAGASLEVRREQARSGVS